LPANRAGRSYLARVDGKGDSDAVQERFGIGDGDAGMKADAEGEAERAGVAVAGSDGDTNTGGQAEGSQAGGAG
jgi:hypothetical protein